MAECFDQAHHQTSSDDGRQNRNEDITKCLDQTFPPRHVGSRRCFDILFGTSSDTGHGNKLVIDFIDRTSTDDDLQLSIGIEDTLYTLCVLNCLDIYLAVVDNCQTQSRCAVCSTGDVVFSTQMGIDLFRTLSVIQCHKLILPLDKCIDFLFSWHHTQSTFACCDDRCRRIGTHQHRMKLLFIQSIQTF